MCCHSVIGNGLCMHSGYRILLLWSYGQGVSQSYAVIGNGLCMHSGYRILSRWSYRQGVSQSFAVIGNGLYHWSLVFAYSDCSYM